MCKKSLFLVSLFSFSLFAIEPALVKELRDIEASLFIQDGKGALKRARKAKEIWPNSKEVQAAYIQSLVSMEEESFAFSSYLDFRKNFEEDWDLLEKIAWGVIQKGIKSSQYQVQIISLLGAFFTQDVEAVKIMQKMMNSPHTMIRALAMQLSCYYGDDVLAMEIVKRLSTESSWHVRVELIKAIGKFRIKEQISYLENILQTAEFSFEEKKAAVESICELYDDLSLEKLALLAKDERAFFRILASHAIGHFKKKEAKNILVSLFHDQRPDVRASALNAYALTFFGEKEENVLLEKLMHDTHPEVAITASWILFLQNPTQEHLLERWLNSSSGKKRLLAAAAVAAAGERGVKIAKKMIRNSEDPFVKLNLALALLRQREDLSMAKETILKALQNKSWWMKQQKGAFFSYICPSKIRRNFACFAMPETVDQMVRFEIFSLLSYVEEPRVKDFMKSFLQEANLQVKSEVILFLLKEKDFFATEIVEPLLEEKDQELRLRAALLLAIFAKEPKAVAVLEQAYSGATYEQKLEILEGMTRVGKRENIAFFLKVLNEPHPALRTIGASALLQAMNR